MHLIAVYGSLKRGFGNHSLLAKSRFVAEATTEPTFTMLSLGGFPGIVAGGETAIWCEVYEVDKETLHRLDRLEGHPDFYKRQDIHVITRDGKGLAVQGYVLPPVWLKRAQQIKGGIWAKGGGNEASV